MTSNQCKGITKKGVRCKNKSSSSMCYCHSTNNSTISLNYSEKPSLDFCKNALKKKISINIHEKRWTSPKQAVAVSYSQVKKWFPECKKYLER